MTPTERYNKFIIFDPDTDSLVRVGAGLDKVYRENNKNFQPRFGFAWDPSGSVSRLMVRTLSRNRLTTTPGRTREPLSKDSFNLRGSRGVSDFDARHRFVLTTLYELPFKGNRAVEGWQLSTIIQ